MHTWRRWVVDAPARRRSSRAPRRGLPLLQLLGGLALVAAEFGDQRDHPGVDAGHQPVGFLALVAAYQQPAGAAGQIGHFRAPLIEDQTEAGAQPIPALLERRDARVAVADLEGDGCGGKGLLEFADSRAYFSIC